MKRTIRRYKIGYALGAVLFAVGIAALLVVTWKILPEARSDSISPSAIWTLLWVEQFSIIPGVQFKLVYLVILSVSTMTSGAAVFAFSRQWFALPGETKRFQCPFCRRHWRTSHDIGQVTCPHCQHLVHPKIT